MMTDHGDEQITTLWSDYAVSRSEKLRNILVEYYLYLVKRHALSVVRERSGAEIHIDDLLGEGGIGLIEAVERYDPDRPVPFEQASRLRIRGAMLDYLRRQTYVSKSAQTEFRVYLRLVSGLLMQVMTFINDPPWEDEVLLRELYAGNSDCLSATEVKIIWLRHKNQDTWREVAECVGLDTSHVRRVYRGALDKLRAKYCVAG